MNVIVFGLALVLRTAAGQDVDSTGIDTEVDPVAQVASLGDDGDGLDARHTAAGSSVITAVAAASARAEGWPRSEVAVMIATHGVMFYAALWFFKRLLYRDYEVKRHYIQVLFAATFAASASMLLLVLATLTDALTPGFRTVAWKVDHWTLIALSYVVLPFCFVWNVMRSVCNCSHRIARGCACISLPIFWYLIFQSGRLIGIDSLSLSADVLIARVGVLGVTVVATLSGFGAVNFPFSSVHSLLRPVTQQQVADVEQRLLRTTKFIASKKRQMQSLQPEQAKVAPKRWWHGAGGTSRGDETSGTPFMRRLAVGLLWMPLKAAEAVVNAAVSAATAAIGVPITDMEQERQRLRTEVEALEGFSRELFIELDELIKARMRELKAQTTIGRVLNVLGWACSGICTYKIVMSSVNLLLRQGRAQAEDPATRLLNLLLVYLQIPLDISYWAPVLSLIFVGYLTFANTRQFIQRLLSVFRMVSTSVTSNSLALLLTEVMAMYFAACVLLTLRFVPLRDRADLLAVHGEVDLAYVHLHFDYVFLVSSMCTLAVFGIGYWLTGKQKDDTIHYE